MDVRKCPAEKPANSILDTGHELLELSPLRGVFRPKTKDLIIADLHLGKAAHFRKHGIPVPSLIQDADLNRLSLLIEEFAPSRLIIAGDMFHQNLNADTRRFEDWRGRFNALPITLVLGNHDRLKAHLYDRFHLHIVNDVFSVENLSVVHHHTCPGQTFCISGHLHPGVAISGRARQHLRLPCFVLGENHLVLPAFSQFSGSNTKDARKIGLKYFAIGNNRVFEV